MRRAFLAAVPGTAVAFLLGATAPGTVAAAAAGHRAARRAVVERAAVVATGSRTTGAMPTDSALHGTIVLTPRDDGALTRFITRVSDPSSPSYGNYLRHGTFARRFGPTAATRRAVADQLRREGLRVGHVSSDGLLLPFSGTAAQADRAFATDLQTVRSASGRLGHVATSPVTLPSSIAPDVTAILGLDQPTVQHNSLAVNRTGRAGHAATTTSSSSTTGSAGPAACPAAAAAAQKNGGLTDDQIASTYGATGLYDSGDTGQGEHIALYELEPFSRSDIKTFDNCYYGAARAKAMLARLHVHSVLGGQPRGAGDEATLDVEDIEGLAPGASVDVYVGPQTTGVGNFDSLAEYAAIVDDDHDQIVSSSWGECEQAEQRGDPGQQQAENLVFQQAAAQGQTVFAAAGDTGSDDCENGVVPRSGQNVLSVDDPASQPYVVGVGATAINDARPSDPLEQVWNDGAAEGAGGGGISMSWQMPAWQAAARVPGIARPGGTLYRDANRVEDKGGDPTGFCRAHLAGATAQTPCRLVPDVSAEGDEFTGSITVYSKSFVSKRTPDGWTTIGGTSSATPIWASALALTDASPACASAPRTRAGVGFAAPLLYDVASDPAQYKASFNDVRAGNNDIFGLGDGTVFAAGRGYDLASGLGSPRLTGADGTAGLSTYLCRSAREPSRPVVTRLSPRSGSTAGGERLTITGRGFSVLGHAQVASVQIGSWRVSGHAVTVAGPHTIRVTLPPAGRTVPPGPANGQTGAGQVRIVVALRSGATSVTDARSAFVYVSAHPTAVVPHIEGSLPSGGPAARAHAVTILGSGFTRGDRVSFGGVAARHVTVLSADRMRVLAPRRTARTKCVALPHHGVYRHENAANDVCQIAIRITSRAGRVSPALKIMPPVEGALITDALGDLTKRPHCHCEVAPAADEYDYLPQPEISSVSTSFGPEALASEHGGTIVTITGRGLDPLGLVWADFGKPGRFGSVDTNYLYATGTVMQIKARAIKLTAGMARVPLSLRTLAGQSKPITAQYAGVPKITSVVNARNARNLSGLYGAPDTGRTPLKITGRGLGNQVLALTFIGNKKSFSYGTQYTFHAHGARRMTAQTVSQNSAVVTVSPCTVTGCTKRTPTDLFWLYPPGSPHVTSLSTDTGPPTGGTPVMITGHNLGCPISAEFGSSPASGLTPITSVLECGSTTSVTATSPAGPEGSNVPVTVETAESFYSGSQPSSSATFAYR